MATPATTPAPRAMILAAGFGTRLQHLTQLRPKPMLPVAGAPLVRWSTLWLRHHGITDVVVNLHHLGEQIAEELGDGRALGMNVRYSHEAGMILGTGGGLRKARPLLDQAGGGHPDAPIVVVNGKIMVDLDLRAVLARHAELRAAHGVEATMVLREDREGVWKGNLRATTDGRLSHLLDESRPGTTDADLAGADTPLMFTGVHVFQPSFLDRVPAQGEQCIVRTAYMQAFREGKVGTHVTDGYWWEHSTIERYLAGMRNVLDGAVGLPYAEGVVAGVDPSARIDPSAEIHGPVHIGPGAVIEAKAVVGPYAQVGAGATVAGGAAVHDAIVWPGARARGQVEHTVVT